MKDLRGGCSDVEVAICGSSDMSANMARKAGQLARTSYLKSIPKNSTQFITISSSPSADNGTSSSKVLSTNGARCGCGCCFVCRAASF